MPFRLANVAGRAALVADDRTYDLATVTGGAFDPDPMAAVARFHFLIGNGSLPLGEH